MKNLAMQKMVQAFTSVQSATPVAYQHAMRGISDATTGIVEGSHYEFGSRYENRANRFQARATIESTQNAMPVLTNQLLAATKGNLKCEALNAKWKSWRAPKLRNQTAGQA